MKKLFTSVLLVFISLMLISQNKQIIKVGLNRDLNYKTNIIGIDFGEITKNKYYSVMDVAFPLYENAPAYFNLGCGPMISKNIYVIGLFGIYSPNRKTLLVNAGIEFGTIINKNIIISSFGTVNNVVGIKIGYILK